MEAIGDLVWERRHGRVKRIATVAALVQREGWLAQCAASDQELHGGSTKTDTAPATGNGQPSPNGNGRLNRGDAPRLTVDAAMLLVDQALRAAGSTQACTREEVEAALTHLTDPLIGSATWLDPTRTAIAVLAADPILN
jgi:hypothetical protein